MRKQVNMFDEARRQSPLFWFYASERANRRDQKKQTATISDVWQCQFFSRLHSTVASVGDVLAFASFVFRFVMILRNDIPSTYWALVAAQPERLRKVTIELSQGPMSLPKNALSPPERYGPGWHGLQGGDGLGRAEGMDMAGPTLAPSRREATACLKGCG